LASSDTYPEEAHLFIAISTIIVVLALGTWWFFLSEAAAARRREEKQRELERPDHDYERALEKAKLESELSRIKGWTGTGA
jgi:Tfp pilus assembly protein PilO